MSGDPSRCPEVDVLGNDRATRVLEPTSREIRFWIRAGGIPGSWRVSRGDAARANLTQIESGGASRANSNVYFRDRAWPAPRYAREGCHVDQVGDGLEESSSVGQHQFVA